jgi:uncharacterized protein
VTRPLDDFAYVRLAAVLGRSPRAMNVEMLEGFFAALVCCPDTVRPSEYLRVIWGGDVRISCHACKSIRGSELNMPPEVTHSGRY